MKTMANNPLFQMTLSFSLNTDSFSSPPLATMCSSNLEDNSPHFKNLTILSSHKLYTSDLHIPDAYCSRENMRVSIKLY